MDEEHIFNVSLSEPWSRTSTENSEAAYIDGERQAELRRVTPRSTEGSTAFEINGVTHWYSQAQEEAMTEFNNTRRTIVSRGHSNNQGLLAQIEDTNTYSQYPPLTEEILREHIADLLSSETDPEPSRSPSHYSVATLELMQELENISEGDITYIQGGNTVYIYDGDNWIAQVNTSAVRNQVATVRGDYEINTDNIILGTKGGVEEEKETQSKDFLANIEK